VVGHYFSRRPEAPERWGLLRCRLKGLEFEFVTSSGVFSPRALDRGTRLLVESMIIPERGAVLDVGCGYGPVGIAAARIRPGLEVWMTDVNERAITLAEENARRNRVGDVIVRQGDLYEPVGDAVFTAILSNPPISAGMRRMVEPLVGGAVDRLLGGGSLQLVAQSNKGGRTVASLMEGYFGGVEVVARGGGYRVLMSVKG
jgi:16S rRNA (guanine1207-N2)-methyltransferase